MIITKLTGGLGNQMFQYALGRYLAINNHTVLKYIFRDTSRVSHREYSLNCFNINMDKANVIDILGQYIFSGLRIVKERNYNFDSKILNIQGNIFLSGYWQSEKYFSQITDVIRQDYTFKKPPDKMNNRLLLRIQNSQSVSIHIRRMDYVSDVTTNKYHGICSNYYYEKAISFIKYRVKNPKFYIFSDDITWCKNNIKFINRCIYADFNKGDNDYEDMRLISNCKHNIIANSSFSWWGAWLNNNKNKYVIAPRNWFRDKSVSASDLVPKEWIRF